MLETANSESDRIHGLTRARVTQVLNLLKFPPEIIAFLKGLASGPFARLYSERRGRPLLAPLTDRQWQVAAAILPGLAGARRGVA